MDLYTVLNRKQAAAFRVFCLSQHHHLLDDVGAGAESTVVAVGAHAMNIPYGLAMASIGPDGNAELVALFVADKHRRRGVASEMMGRLTDQVRLRGGRQLRALFELGRPYSDSVAGFLNASGFSPPEPHALSCRCLFDRMRDASFLSKIQVPSSFALFPWTELTEDDRDDINDRQAKKPWFPEELSPFARGDFEPLNSLGLRFGDDVVGWQINHRIARDTIQYSITFVRDDLQPLGLGVLLMVESTKLHIRNPDPALNKAYFRVPFAMHGMIQYVESRLAPFIDERNDCVSATKGVGERRD